MRLPDCSECQTRLLINIVTLCNTQTNTQKDTRIPGGLYCTLKQTRSQNLSPMVAMHTL